MIEISELLADPDFTAPVTLYRSEGEWKNGKFISGETPVVVMGSVQPADDEDVVMTPQGDQIQCDMLLYTASPVYVTREKGVSDEMEWRGERYRIMGVEEWTNYGYNKAKCTRKAGR